MDTRAMAVALLTKWSWDKMLDVKTVWHLWRTEITVRIHSFSCLCAIISTTQGRWSRVQVQTTKANGKGLFLGGGEYKTNRYADADWNVYSSQVRYWINKLHFLHLHIELCPWHACPAQGQGGKGTQWFTAGGLLCSALHQPICKCRVWWPPTVVDPRSQLMLPWETNLSPWVCVCCNDTLGLGNQQCHPQDNTTAHKYTHHEQHTGGNQRRNPFLSIRWIAWYNTAGVVVF